MRKGVSKVASSTLGSTTADTKGAKPKPAGKSVQSRADPSARPETRAQILEQAAKLLRQHGYAAVSLRDIATAAGIKAGSIYYHFESKEEILFHVLEEGLRVITEEVDKAVATLPANACFNERLAVAIRGHLHGLLQVGDFSSANIRIYGQVPDEVRKRHYVSRRAYADWWDHFLARAVEEGRMSPHLDLSIARSFIVGALNWTVEWYRSDRGSFDEFTDQLVAIVSHGLLMASEQSQ